MNERTEVPDEGLTPTAPQLGPAAVPAALEARAAQHTQELLAEHVPLALLVDLVNVAGPASQELLTTEGLPEVEWWRSPEGEQVPGA